MEQVNGYIKRYEIDIKHNIENKYYDIKVMAHLKELHFINGTESTQYYNFTVVDKVPIEDAKKYTLDLVEYDLNKKGYVYEPDVK